MAVLDRLISLRAAGPSPTDDFWYRRTGESGVSTAGVVVNQETALKIATVWRCVNLIADSIGQLPLHVYRRRPDGGKERQADHPLDRLLSDSPNGWQTSMEWRTQEQAHLLLRGNGYNRIVAGPRGFAGEVRPLLPDRMNPPRLVQGRMLYEYRNPDTNQTEAIPADEMLHLRGLSLDGVAGLSTISYARESFGHALAVREYGARFFSQNTVPPGYLTTDAKLTDTSAKQQAKSWFQSRAGLGNAHQVAILDQGLKFQGISISPEDAQMIASSEFNAYDICTWFGVPPHLAGLVTKTTSWGSGVEAQTQNFLTFTLLGWLTRWEQRIGQDLLLERDRVAGYFVEHIVTGFLRGDSAARAAFYEKMRGWGAYSINDVLRKENENPIDEPWADERIVPLNYRDASTPAPTPPPPGSTSGATGRAVALATIAARRLVGRQTEVLRKTAARTGIDVEAWRAEVGRFYDTFAGYVAEQLDVPRADADAYCKGQADALVEHGAAAMTDWDSAGVERLTRLALREHGGDA